MALFRQPFSSEISGHCAAGRDAGSLESHTHQQTPAIVRKDNGEDWKTFLKKLPDKKGLRSIMTMICVACISSVSETTKRKSLRQTGNQVLIQMPASVR